MNQDDSPDLAPQAGKVAPEAVALRAQPRPAAPGHAPEQAHAGHPRWRPIGRRARRHDLVIAAASARGG